MTSLIPSERIEKSILLIRGYKVMLDTDLAALYGVSPKRLNEQVKRNRQRFPADFMFQLTKKEVDILRSQIATLKPLGRGRHRKYLPYAFTEHWAVMLASGSMVSVSKLPGLMCVIYLLNSIVERN